MCGIAGILYPLGTRPNIERQLVRMKGALRHRGPDDDGIYIDAKEPVGLAHTRLSIIDLSAAGHQPMPDRENGSWLTYNGEIYNYKELRSELNGDARVWQSESDTEVMLRAYQRWGSGFTQRLRGMFALALWDNQRGQLLLARDPFGIKPLYYYAGQNVFAFASEVRALLASGIVPRTLSLSGLASYLQYGSVTGPLTMIEGVRSLPPGHHLVVAADDGGVKIEQHSYTDNLFNRTCGSAISRAQAIEAVRSKLEDSVRAHMVSDVPVAAFLSGGVDSSAIVALMSRVVREKPRTFTVVFAESEFSEESYAHLVASRFETEHRDVPISESRLLEMLSEALAAMDQPTMDGINTYAVSKAVKDAGFTVALSGLGGDELFAGYPSFRRAQRLRALSLLPSRMTRAVSRAGQAVLGGSPPNRKAWDLLAGGGTPGSVYHISRRLFAEDEILSLAGGNRGSNGKTRGPRLPEGLFSASSPIDSSDRLNAVSRYELQGYMANTLLRDTDQMSMAHSLEARVPFVDTELASFVLGLPGKWKIDGQRPKPLLLDALGDLLPPEVWRRRKMGFTLPFEKWMRSSLKRELDDAFADDAGLRKIGLSGFVTTVWENFGRHPRSERWGRPWALYALKNWCELNQVYL